MLNSVKIELLLLVAMLTCSILYGQSDTTFAKKTMFVKERLSEIIIDGEFDEQAWLKAEVYSDFWVHTPIDGIQAEKQTEFSVVYDGTGIYIAITLYDDPNYVISSLKRDDWGSSDEIGILLDPLNKNQNGVAFGLNPAGAQTEALLFPNDGDDSWDNKWRSAVKNYDDRWTAEVFIPFKSLRFEPDNLTWGIQFMRRDPGGNQSHVWSPVPRQFDNGDLGYFGQMVWDKAPQGKKGNINLIPYVSGISSKNFNTDESNNDIQIGGDAKIGITKSLNLDLTVNPDFSQVEVDNQVTNLTRFNIFFPEKRQFFIENSDLFNGFGQFANRPFYSRRIGLDAVGQTVPIEYGARLTGNLTEKLRIGVLNMQTDKSAFSNKQNFTAATFQQSIGQRSTVKGIFLNRQAYADGETVDGDFGRNFGGELNLATPNGKFAGQLGLVQSDKEGFNDKNRHLYGRFDYSGEQFRTFLFVQNIGTNYFADMGFNNRINNFDPINNQVVRIGYTQIGTMQDYYIYPEKSEKVNFHWSGLENFIIINEGTGLNDWYTRLRHFIFYKNSSQLRFRLNHQFIDLLFPFALGAEPLPVDEYDVWEFNIEYRSDSRKLFNFRAFSVYGGFYNGNKFTNILDLNLRQQPWGSFSVGLENNTIRLPDPYGKLDLLLATAKAEISFNRSVFWTTFLQYNTQADRFNVNSRLQWRFAPMSDIFLVYTDNYFTEGKFTALDRTLVLKANYWFGL